MTEICKILNVGNEGKGEYEENVFLQWILAIISTNIIFLRFQMCLYIQIFKEDL